MPEVWTIPEVTTAQYRRPAGRVVLDQELRRVLVTGREGTCRTIGRDTLAVKAALDTRPIDIQIEDRGRPMITFDCPWCAGSLAVTAELEELACETCNVRVEIAPDPLPIEIAAAA